MPDIRRIWKTEKAKVRRNIIPTIVVPVVMGVALENGTRSICDKAKGEARHCGQFFATCVSVVVFPAFRARNCAVCAIPASVISGLTTARMVGMTLDETVIWLRAEAEKRVSALRGLYGVVGCWSFVMALSRVVEALGETILAVSQASLMK